MQVLLCFTSSCILPMTTHLRRSGADWAPFSSLTARRKCSAGSVGTAAFGIAVNMLVAVFLVHIRNGFFMNWTGTKHGEARRGRVVARSVVGPYRRKTPVPLHYRPQP